LLGTLFIFSFSLYALGVYRIYETEGIIISSRDKGETSRDFKILTREFGVIFASAQGVRRFNSKLKSFLVSFQPVRFFLVRGRETWRIVNVVEIEGSRLSVRERAFVVRPLSLISKLVHGEEPEPVLYSIIQELHESIASLSGRDQSLAEELASLRVAFVLGYVPIPSSFGDIVQAQGFTNETLLRFAPLRPAAITLVNEALRASHLS